MRLHTLSAVVAGALASLVVPAVQAAEEVVIGGGAARAGERLLETAKRVALEYVVPGLGRRTSIRLAWHGVRAGVLGAALLAAHELEAEADAGGDARGGRSRAVDRPERRVLDRDRRQVDVARVRDRYRLRGSRDADDLRIEHQTCRTQGKRRSADHAVTR